MDIEFSSKTVNPWCFLSNFFPMGIKPNPMARFKSKFKEEAQLLHCENSLDLIIPLTLHGAQYVLGSTEQYYQARKCLEVLGVSMDYVLENIIGVKPIENPNAEEEKKEKVESETHSEDSTKKHVNIHPAVVKQRSSTVALARQLQQQEKQLNPKKKPRSLAAHQQEIKKKLKDNREVLTNIMLDGLRLKFNWKLNPLMSYALLLTKSQTLGEAAFRGDLKKGTSVWNIAGENLLGQLLMTVRSEINK